MTVWLYRLAMAGIVLGALWAVGSLVMRRNIEEAAYTVVEQRSGYEIRRYAKSLIAETAMPSLSSADTGTAFRLVAGYIFGANEGRQKINMTGPVTMAPAPEKIAMTAPVTMGAGTMAFILPSKYKSLSELPKPNNPLVKLREVPERTVAALRFGFMAGSDRVTAKTAELNALLARDRVTSVGPPLLAGYDPPFAMPLTKRYEILMDVAPR
jgi:SOUL heme-binding protein